MGRVRRGFRLLEQSWGVLRSDKELALLPIAGAVGMGVVGIGAFLLMFRRWPNGDDLKVPGVFWRLYPIFIIASTISTFANAAVVAAAMERLEGGDPTIRSGLRAAWRKRWQLLKWTMVAGLVGILLRAIAGRLKLAGRLAIWAIGLGWQLAITFVIPVLLFEDEDVAPAVRRSASLFKEHWGENVSGNGAIGLAVVALMLPAVILGGIAGFLLGPVALVVILGAIFLLTIAATGALAGIFNTALYRFATTGTAVGPFDAADLEGAFTPKRPRRRPFRRR
ncbi:MAG: putative rane protein [Acidimicrobiales bacterium]|jgi:hypothetical protein|nr:putative rane protein [Acidimicrobiales bacterium]